MSKKILIINHYAPNRGDSAVLESMVDLFKTQKPTYALSVLAAYPQFCTNKDVKIFKWPIDIEARNAMKMLSIPFMIIHDILWAIFNRYNINFIPTSNKQRKMSLEEYKDAEIIISPGGHHLTDINGFPAFFIQWHQMLLAVLLRKPFVIYAQTIGPFVKYPKTTKFLTKLILKRTNLITVREEISKKRIDEMKIATKVYITADAVFLLEPADNSCIQQILLENDLTPKSQPYIGMTVYPAKYYGHSDPHKKHQEYIEVMAELADYLVETKNAKIVFIPMEMSYRCDDTILIHNIVDRMSNRDNVVILPNKYSSRETMGIIKSMDLFIGAKTHSIVFALTSRVPLICIAYDSKAREFMKMCKQEKFTFDIDQITLQDLVQISDIAWKNRSEIIESLTQEVPKIQRMSFENYTLISNIFS